MVLLQKIETYTKHRNRHGKEILKTLLRLDETQKVFLRNSYGDPTSDLGQSKAFLDKLFSNYFTEFRLRGIGTIISDQTPSTLMRAAVTEPNIKVLFKIDKSGAVLYTDELDFRQFIQNQSNSQGL